MLQYTLAEYYDADTKPSKYFRCYHLYVIEGFGCCVYVGSTSIRCRSNGLLDRLRAKLVKSRAMPKGDRGDYYVRYLINQIPDDDYKTLNEFIITVLQPDEIDGILTGNTSIFYGQDPRTRRFGLGEILKAEKELIEYLGPIFTLSPKPTKPSPVPDEIIRMMGDKLPKHLKISN